MGLRAEVQQARAQAGIRVTRPATALGNIGNHDIFTITGPVLIKRLTGVVTVILAAVAATIRLQLNSIGGAVALDSATLASNGIAAGSMLQLPDVSTANTLAWVNAVVPIAGYALGVGADGIGLMANGGTIRLVVGGANSSTGAVQWIVVYSPLTDQSRIVPT